MAEYRTLTGTFAISCVKRKWNNDSMYENDSEEFTSENYVGHTYSSNAEGWDYRIRLLPTSEEVFYYTDSSKVVGCRLKIRYKRKTTIDTTTMIAVKRGIYAVTTTDAETLYLALGSSNYYRTFTSFLPQTTTEEVEDVLYQQTAYTTELGYVQKYGCGILYESIDIVQILSVTLELDVADEEIPPEISFKATQGGGVTVDGTYHHDPNKMFTIGVDYSQVAEDALQTLTATVTGLNGGENTFTSSTEYVNVSADTWEKLPVSGTITLVAKSNKATSNTLTIPYVIDEYDVHFTSPTSGSIIQSDSDVTISWEAVAPSTQTMDAPNKYLAEIWFDSGDENGGDYTTLTSKTITADQLAGHNQLHMRLYSYYANAQTSKEASPVMNLYIQQVAGTGNVEVVKASQKPHIIIVSWESTGQTAYQVRVGDFTSDILWGDDTQYKVPFVLEIGVMYPIQVRIQDTQGNWSEWTEQIYFIPTLPLYEDLEGVTAIVTDGGVEIQVSRPTKIVESTYTQYKDVVIYRDDVPIAVLPIAEQVQYVDSAANGNTEYSVVITRFFEDDQCGLAAWFAPVTIDATPTTDGLVLADKTWVPLRCTTEELAYNGSVSEEVYQKYYSGRSYPVVMRSGRKTETLNLSYADLDGTLVDVLSEHVGETVLFKNRDGMKFWGCLESITPNRRRGWAEVSMVLRKVDVNEWVPLVWGDEE